MQDDQTENTPSKLNGKQNQRNATDTKVNLTSPPLSPGDEAAPGTIGTGDDICPNCKGSGKIDGGKDCPNCGGTGFIIEGIGGG